jgi:hypothetical protein
VIDDILDKTLDVQFERPTKSPTGAKVIDSTHGRETKLRDVACTFWPAQSKTREDYARRDQVAEFEFCTAIDLQAEPGNTITCERRTYTVLGNMPYDNSAFGEPVYITVVGKRNQVKTPTT